MDEPTPLFPNELWMRVFSFIPDAPSLHSVILTSRRFYTLGIEDLLRTLVWSTTEMAENHLQFWEANTTLVHLPTTLSMNLGPTEEDVMQRAAAALPNNNNPGPQIIPHAAYRRALQSLLLSPAAPAIFNHVSLFRNLHTLCVVNTVLPPVFYHVLLTLPTLTHLDLQACDVPGAPPKFPFTYPSFWDKDIDRLEIGVTHLTLRAATRYPRPAFDPFGDDRPIELLDFLPDLEALTLEDLPAIGSAVLQRLHSLTLLQSDSREGIVEQLNKYLPHTPNLVELNVAAPWTLKMPDTLSPITGGHLPLLQRFTGPEFVAHAIRSSAPSLEALAVNHPLATTDDAIALIEYAAIPATLREIELKLEKWDDEVLLAIVRHLRACHTVKVLFRSSQPSDDFLFNLGVEHLPSLADLNTLHLHGTIAVLPAEDVCEEALVAWTRYNKNLRAVRFVPRREWARKDAARRWEVGSPEK